MTDFSTDSYSPLKVADMNEDDRPREKALRHGVGTLTDAELIAIILGSGFPGMSVVDLARKILSDCDNSLNKLARIPVKELTRRYKGLGPVKAVTLAAAIGLGLRVRDEAIVRDPVITASRDVFDYMRTRLEHLDHEEFWVLLLNRRNRVVATERVSQGGMASTIVDLPLLFRTILSHGYNRIIAVHNHPSSNPQPSSQDDSLTKRISAGAKTLDITLLDHIIVAGDRHYSYSDEGRL